MEDNGIIKNQAIKIIEKGIYKIIKFNINK